MPDSRAGVWVERSYIVRPIGLYEVLTSPGYLKERGRRYGGVEDPTVERSPGAVTVTTTRQIPMDKVPSGARRYLGDGRIVQVDRWTEPRGDDSVLASLTVDAGRMPLEMTGRHEIRPTASGCVYVIEADVAVNVPVVGRAMRGAVAAQLEKLMSAEMAFAESWMSRDAG